MRRRRKIVCVQARRSRMNQCIIVLVLVVLVFGVSTNANAVGAWDDGV